MPEEKNLTHFNKKIKPSGSVKVRGKTRIRLSQDQIAFLELEFQKDANFSSTRVTKVAERIGLPRTKVYKWTWDRRQQQLKDPNLKVSVKELEELEERAKRALDAYRTGETLLAKHFR